MRLRNIPGSRERIKESVYCIDAPEAQKGRWSEVFEKGEVEKIYLNFSDPWPKERHAKRRLTSLAFLRRYEAVLLRGAMLEF